MDDRLEKALEHANYKSTIEIQRKNLELRYQNALLYSVDGGTFSANMELINFVDFLIRNGQEDAVIIDAKNKPIMVNDLVEFLAELSSVYFEASNQYFMEFEKLRKARSVKLALDI